MWVHSNLIALKQAARREATRETLEPELTEIQVQVLHLLAFPKERDDRS